MGRVLVGTSSWADQTLVQSGFYPPDIKTPAGRLRYYSQIFPLAEIDSSYHFIPTLRNINLWLENTPTEFVFNIKAFSLFTGHPTPQRSIPKALWARLSGIKATRGHFYIQNLPEEIVDELWRGFAEVAELLNQAGKLGLIFFQFPPWFHPTEKNLEHLAYCREKLEDYRVAAEFRTGDWLSEGKKEMTLEFLEKHRIALICVDGPQGLKSSVPPLAKVTASIGVVRFHGRNRENWEKKGIPAMEKFNYLYNEDELKEWLPKIKRMAKKTEELHLVFKNKHRDFSVQNARQMIKLLDRLQDSNK